MAKKESTFLNMVLTLMIITAIASLALGSVYNMTKEPIAKAQQEKRERAIREVLPGFDELETYMVKPATGKDSLMFSIGYKDGAAVGTAVQTYSTEGYDATPIMVMVGILPDGSLQNTALIGHKETPGLGTKMGEPKFKDQFMGVDPATFNMQVSKDGGDVDAITAATISSRAFCDAVNRAYESYKTEGGQK